MSLVLLDKSDGVGTITLNNPGERNTLTAPMVAEIIAAMDDIEGDESIGAVVVTGAAPAFCAGANLGNLAEATGDSLKNIYEGFLRIAYSPLPTLAAVILHAHAARFDARLEQVREALDAAVQRVLDGGWYIHGREVTEFEREFAAYLGVGHAVGVANGTDAIELALADASPPDAYVIEGLTAFDIWAGYVALDAWVAGRDRHHENWGVIAGPEQRRVLAPSFDHGNALGFQESDERCQALVSSPASMEKWAARGTSHHFAGRPTLVDVAHEAMRRSTDAARSIWLPNIASVTEAEVAEIVDLVPSEKMSEPSRNFCKALLMLNQRRLCDVD